MLTYAQLSSSQGLLLCCSQPRHLLQATYLHSLEVLLCLVDNSITQILIDNSFMIINFQYLFFTCSLNLLNVRMHCSKFLLLSRFFIVIIGHYSLFSIKIHLYHFLSCIPNNHTKPNTLLNFNHVQCKRSECILYFEICARVLQFLQYCLLRMPFHSRELGILQERKYLPNLDLRSPLHVRPSWPDKIPPDVKLELKNTHGDLGLPSLLGSVVIESIDYLP